jgi:hypothetical protein
VRDAEGDAPGDGADAVVWEELIARTGEDSRLSGSFQVFLTIAWTDPSVHGAWADGSSWNAVASALRTQGFTHACRKSPYRMSGAGQRWPEQ